jgi:FtsP/CotA-like multicopper oxidase with cupredoxin domain
VDALQIPANTFNNPNPIPMWGFVRTNSQFSKAAGSWKVGATLTAAEGDTLRIHVRNNLGATSATGAFVEPVSVVIPGQPGGNFTPTWTDNTTGPRTNPNQRVRSFTTETADGDTVVYTWTNLKAGTYLYQSGTHPAVQQQMGLYGALKVYSVAPVAPAKNGRAYTDTSSTFESEALLLFSEIDPVLHNAVATGNYGPGKAVTSTIDYHPSYFLINGKASSLATRAGVPRVQGGASGQNLLIRFLNAGLEPKVPIVQGPDMSIIAEDGNFMTAVNTAGTVIAVPKRQYSILLPPGKTADAIIAVPDAGLIPVYDRRLSLSNGPTSPGGMLAYLRIK